MDRRAETSEARSHVDCSDEQGHHDGEDDPHDAADPLAALLVGVHRRIVQALSVGLSRLDARRRDRDDGPERATPS